MKLSHAIIFAAALALSACTATSGPAKLTDWKMQQEGSRKVCHVTVPCTVAGALNEAGAFGEGILEQDRYFKADKSQFDSPWVFTTGFRAAKGLNHILRFNGIGYSADIWVNGHQIASADTTYGVFCVREFDITRYAKAANTLKVRVFKAPEQSLNNGFVDWNPRPLDESMGIWREVELISTPDVQIEDVFVRPEVNPDDLSAAAYTEEITLINRSGRKVSGMLRSECEAGTSDSELTLGPGERQTVKVRRTVGNPRIWWPHDMGTPELYHLKVAFMHDGQVSHSREVRFGLRDITSEVDAAGHRQFRINGRPVLVKAGGWADDIFMQDTHGRTAGQVELVRNMGLNCIRFENIWSKDGFVYDMCDSLGLMTMVGWNCQWEWTGYCGLPEKGRYGCINEPEFEDLAVRYLHDQLIWMRNHPSLISWGMGSDKIPNEQLEKRYMELYGKLEYRPYVCSSSGLASKYGGPSGMKMMGPYEYVGPEYWYLDRKLGGAYGFNTETSIGMNLPQIESLKKTLGEEHLWPLDSVWDRHCTSAVEDMNSTREALRAVTGQYGAPTDFEDFVRKAHALDYDGTRAMFEAFRCNVPNSTGIVQWMLNSAWPSLYWQLIDWYLVPTAGYYGTQRACQPVQLVFNYGDRCVWAVDDNIPEGTYTAAMDIYGPDSKLIRTETKVITIRPREPQKVFDAVEGPCFIFLKLQSAHGSTINNFYCIPARGNVHDWARSNWYQTPVSEYADLRFVSALPEAKVSLTALDNEACCTVSITNESDVIAHQIILKAKDARGNLIPAAQWSDNFISLAPGESRSVTCMTGEEHAKTFFSLDGWNVSN